LRFYLNESSLQGQFVDENEFRRQIKALLSARRRSPILAAMRTTPQLTEQAVSPTRNFREVIQSGRDRDLERAVLEWITKTGPFIHEDQLQEDEDIFYCLGFEVTEGGLGEAGRRVKAGERCAAMSFPGGPCDFARSPLPVVHGFEDEPIATYDVENFWNLEKALQFAFDIDKLASTWEETIKVARNRFSKLLLSDNLWKIKKLASQPFDPVIRDQCFRLLCCLNEYMKGHNSDGSEGVRSSEIKRNFFQGGNALFSDESDTNKRDYEKEMTFEDPEGGEPIVATWHGKIRHRQFRIHFEWPVPSKAKVIKILYIGPKITKK